MPTKTPPNYCGATIKGPRVGRKVVSLIKHCRQRVPNPGDRCRFHDGSGSRIGAL